MLKDITLGQYFPINSPLHKMDPRTKILGLVVFIVLIFVINSTQGYVLALGFTLLTMILSKVPVKMYLKSIKPLWFIVLFTALLNMFLTKGTYILKWGNVGITHEGLILAVKMALRLVMLLCSSAVLTYTTSPIELTDGIEKLLSPFSKLGLPSHELAMMMSIAIRFIPTLIEETEKIMKAQQARGASFDTGSIFEKAKSLIPMLVPLFISAFRRADDLALAMESRCYRGGKGRTRMKEIRFKRVDTFAFAVFLIFCVLIILTVIFC